MARALDWQSRGRRFEPDLLHNKSPHLGGFCYFSTMQITKINEDSTWLLQIDGLKVLIDPWLSPSQIDFHPWFSRQFHNQPQVAIETLPQPDFIFISHPFTDHCNKETLLQFAADTPIVALPPILKKIQKWQHFNTLLSLDEAPFTLRQLKTKRALVHKAFQISSKEKSLIYAPHGAVLSEDSHANVLITTTLSYRLPFFIGGTINMGLQKALVLKEKIGASYLLATHDEQKRAEGFVSKVASVKFEAHPEVLSLEVGATFIVE